MSLCKVAQRRGLEGGGLVGTEVRGTEQQGNEFREAGKGKWEEKAERFTTKTP